MKRNLRTLAATLAVFAAGCGTVEKLWSGGPAERSRVPAGVTEFVCDGNRILRVRFESGEKSAWVVLPEREFRLDAVPGGPAGRYSNGRNTLNATTTAASLEEGSNVAFANCKRAAGG